MKIRQKFLHFSTTHIAGFSYWNWVKIFSKLKIGKKLKFKREHNNKYDKYAIAIYVKNEKIGYIPRENNFEIAKMIDAWYEKIFKIRINRISASEHPENQIWISIFIKNKNP